MQFLLSKSNCFSFHKTRKMGCLGCGTLFSGSRGRRLDHTFGCTRFRCDLFYDGIVGLLHVHVLVALAHFHILVRLHSILDARSNGRARFLVRRVDDLDVTLLVLLRLVRD
jgi:hypothetical protein